MLVTKKNRMSDRGGLRRRRPPGRTVPIRPPPEEVPRVTVPPRVRDAITRAAETAAEESLTFDQTAALAEFGIGGLVAYYGIEAVKDVYRIAKQRWEQRNIEWTDLPPLPKRPRFDPPGLIDVPDKTVTTDDVGDVDDLAAIRKRFADEKAAHLASGETLDPDTGVWKKIKGFIPNIPSTGNPVVDAGVSVAKTAFGIHSLYELYNSYYTMPHERTASSDHPAQGTMQMGSGPDFHRGKSSWSGNGNYVDNASFFSFDETSQRGFISMGLNRLVVGHNQWNRNANQICMCSSDSQFRVSMLPSGANRSVVSGQLSLYVIYDRMGWTGLTDIKEIFSGKDYKGVDVSSTLNTDGLCMDDRFRFKIISKTTFDLRPNGSTGVEVDFPSFPLSNQRAYRRMGRVMSRYKDATTPEPVVMGGLYLAYSGINLGGVQLYWRHRLRFVPS